MAFAAWASSQATAAAATPVTTGRMLRSLTRTYPMMSTMTMAMPTGKNSFDSGVSTDAAADGTSLSSRNRLSSQPSVPVCSKTAATPNSTAPRPARSTAVPALGTRTGRFGHHHDLSEIIKPDPGRVCSGPPCWLTADADRNPAATIGRHELRWLDGPGEPDPRLGGPAAARARCAGLPVRGDKEVRR